jgi:hypothetical protein
MLLLSILFSATSSGAVPRQSAAAGANVSCRAQKIHVSDMGSSPQAMNFRYDLEKWLSKKKFTVVYDPKEADAILSGRFSSTSGVKRSNLSFRDAELRSPQGSKLWDGDYNITKRNSFLGFGRGHLEDGAIRIVKDIRAACK